MGSCCTGKCSKETQHSKTIDQQLKADRIYPVLFLGTTSSGKTTLLKQIDCIFNDHDEKINQIKNNAIMHVHQIRNNCISNIITLCELIDDEKTIQSLNELSILNNDDLSKISYLISNIWKKDNIKAKYTLRYFYIDDECFMDDNMDYFFDKIDEIMNIKYIPNDSDIIKYKASSYVTKNMITTIEKNKYEFIDAGNYPSISNLYWDKLYIFKTDLGYDYLFGYNFNVIFVAALNDYCVFDRYSNDLAIFESLSYFDHVINSRCFRRVAILLFFNKNDIFIECLRNGISIKNCFKEYNGNEYLNSKLQLVASYISRNIQKSVARFIPIDVIKLIQNYLKVDTHLSDDEYFRLCYDDSFEFIKDQYHQRNKDPSRQIYSHITNAIDDANIKNVLHDVQWRIIINSLQRGS